MPCRCSEAKKLFSDHVKNVAESERGNKSKGLTAGELVVLFLDWIGKKRSKQTFTTRQTRIADLPADK